MRIVIAAWVSPAGATRFEFVVPLLFVGCRNEALGYSTAIDVVFLEGMQFLDSAYRRKLKDCGYVLHDAEPLYRRHAKSFSSLDRFGSFEKYCFLRWLVLADLFAGESLVHFDGDVVFNECPMVLAGFLNGKNVVLQGCPAMVSLHGTEWTSHYTVELARFADDIEGYSARAWTERSGWEISLKSLWAGSRYRQIITSDQDFVSHLIHTRRLPQADPGEVVRAASGYSFIENPLHTGDWIEERPVRYTRIGQVDYLNEKRIAVWHMQSEWCRYLAKHIVRDHLGVLAGTGRLAFREKGWEHYVNAGIRRFTRDRWLHRRAIYQRYFVEKDFSDVLTDRHWWQEGVF